MSVEEKKKKDLKVSHGKAGFYSEEHTASYCFPCCFSSWKDCAPCYFLLLLFLPSKSLSCCTLELPTANKRATYPFTGTDKLSLLLPPSPGKVAPHRPSLCHPSSAAPQGVPAVPHEAFGRWVVTSRSVNDFYCRMLFKIGIF